MNVAFVTLLLWLQYTIVADCLTEAQETHLLKLLQVPRQDNPDSLPLVCDTSDESIFNRYVIRKYRRSRDNVKSIGKYAELIRWTTKRAPGFKGKSDRSREELYLGFLECISTFYGMFGLKFEDPRANAPPPKPHGIYKTVNKTYTVGDCIGSGSFGAIRKAWCSNEPNEVFAMKTEIRGGKELLGNEYLTNQGIQRFHAKFHPKDDLPIAEVVAGSFGKWVDGKIRSNAMIMELLGKDVDALFEMCSDLLSTKSIVVVNEQIVKALRVVHDAGYLHRDVNPANFVVSGNTVKLVDFGLASQYVYNGLYVSPKKRIAGTVAFYPIELLQKIEDCKWEPWFDLGSLGYSMLYLWLGSVDAFCDANTHEHLRLKSVDPATYCVGCPPEFVELLRAVRQRSKVAPEIGQDVINLRPDYDTLLGYLDDLKMKLKINDKFQFDWDRKLYRLLKDPEVHKFSYHTCGEDDTLVSYMYVSKYYSEILMKMQYIREFENAVPLVLDDELSQDAKLMSTDPDTRIKYYNGTVSFTVKLNSLSSWQDIFKALETPYMPQTNEEVSSSSKRRPNPRQGEGSEAVHHFRNTDTLVCLLVCGSLLLPISKTYNISVREPANIYVGFGCSHKLVDNSEGKSMSEFTLTIVLAPEQVEGSESNSHIMSVAHNKVFNNPIPKQGGTEGDVGTNHVTVMARADLSDEDTVSRGILSGAIQHCRKILLEEYSAYELDPKLVGYAYRIDNVENCTIVGVTMFKFLPDYYDILQELHVAANAKGNRGGTV